MPKISSKGTAMPESPIRKLVPYADAAEERGKEIFYLNIGQPDVNTPQVALDAVKNNTLTTIAYSHSGGNPSLRIKLSEYYKKHTAIDVDKEDILVTTGGSEALIFTMGSITNPGDEIIVPEPFYANYYSFSTQMTVTVVPVISKIENDFALPPISDFENLISKKTKAILICNPGNPTGYLYSKEEIQQLTELAIKYDLFLISDEVYREFVYDGTEHYSVLQEERLKEHAIVVDSVSKRYSMCGARIGCIVSRNKEVIKTAMKFAQARLSPPTYAQIASEAALSVPEEYYTEMVAEYKSRRDTLIEGLKLIPNIKVSVPRGAFYCMVELPIHNSEHFAQWMLENFSDNNQTIMVAPALGFYSSLNAGRNQIRIAFVLKNEDLKRATEILGLALNAYLNNQ